MWEEAFLEVGYLQTDNDDNIGFFFQVSAYTLRPARPQNRPLQTTGCTQTYHVSSIQYYFLYLYCSTYNNL